MAVVKHAPRHLAGLGLLQGVSEKDHDIMGRK